MRRPWCSALLALLVGPAGHAQTLNLGGPAEPPPRLELAMAVERRAVEQELRRADPPGPASLASQAMRRLALGLMERGAGPDALRDGEACQSALLGLTIARRREPLDRALREIRDADLLEAAPRVLSLASHATAVEMHAAVQRLFAEVRPGVGRAGGWITFDAEASSVSLVDLATAAGLRPEAIAAVGELENAWQVRLATRAWGRGAGAERADLGDALGLIDPGRRLAPAARLRPWREEIESLIHQMQGAAADVRTNAALARLAAVGRLTEQLAGVRHPAEVRRVVDTLLASELAGPGVDARLAQARAAVESAARAFSPALEREVVRELRLPFREVGLSTRESALPLVRITPELLTRADAMSDPGVLSTLNNHRQRWAELDRIRAVSDLIREPESVGPGGEPRVAEPFRALAARLVAIQRDAATPARREEAQARRRELIDRVVEFWIVPGEEALRAHVSGETGVPGLERATGGRVRGLLDRLDADRAAWLRGTTDPGAPPPAGAETRLRALIRLIPLALDAAACAGGGEGLAAWPGWECGPAAWAWMVGDIEARLSAICAEAVRSNSVDLVRRLDSLEEDHAPGLLAGNLARAWVGRGPAPADPVDATLAELAGPPPEAGVWMGRWRADLARVCLIAEEGAVLASASDGAATRGQSRLAALRRALLEAARPVRSAVAR